MNNEIQIKDEYFLINLSWLKNLKNKYNYKDFEGFFEEIYNQNIPESEINNENFKSNLYSKSKIFKTKIEKDEFKEINRIYNHKILIEDKNKHFIYYQNYAIIDKIIVRKKEKESNYSYNLEQIEKK